MESSKNRHKDLITIFAVGCAVTSLINIPFILDYGLSPRLIAGTVLLIIMLHKIRQEKIIININFVLLAYFLFVAWSCFSVFWAQNISEAIFESSKLITCFCFFLISIFLLEKDKELFFDSLVKISAVIVFVLSFVCLFQFAGLRDLSKLSVYGVTGLNGHKNLLSSFLFLNSLFLLKGILNYKDKWKALCLIALIFNIILIVILRTKAVWLALPITLFSFAFIFSIRKVDKQKWNSIIFVGIVLIFINVFFIAVLNLSIHKTLEKHKDVPNSFVKSFVDQERLLVWEKTYKMIDDHLLVGVGAGNWQIYFPRVGLSGLWRVEDLNFTFQRPHNDFLWILSETGLIGFNLFLLFIVSQLWLLIKHQKTVDDKNIIIQALETAYIIGFLSLSFFDFPKERIEHCLWFNILLAIVYKRACSNNGFKTLKTIVLYPATFKLSIFILSFITVIALLKFKGEYYTRQLYSYKSSNDSPNIIKSGKAAYSIFYTLDPTSVPISWYVGNAYSNMKDYLDAHNSFLEAYKQNPYNRNVLNDLGSSFVMKGQIDSAIVYYKRASKISPRFDEPKLNLAAVYINANLLDEAKMCLDSIYHDSERRSNYYVVIKIKQGIK